MKRRELKGITAAPGLAMAPIVHFHTDLDFIPARQIAATEVPGEVARLEEAIQAGSRSILFLQHELSATLSAHDAKIYDAQLALLHDATFKADLVHEIETGHVNVEVALQRVIARYEKVFEAMEDAAMRERAADVRDVGRQLLRALLEKDRAVFIANDKDYVFAAEEFLPSDAGILDREHLRGIVTARGGKYSHGAILARSLGIPAIVAVGDLMTTARNGERVLVDGEAGAVVLNPDDGDVDRFRQRIAERQAAQQRVFEVRSAPAVTPDGTPVRLMANVESSRDVDHVELDVVAGIGLFRTEFAFMERLKFPGEDEQMRMYRAVIERCGDRVVTFRTLDVGGDKPLRYFRTPEERNPALGWRGLRICLDWLDIFFTQVRAILRAGHGGRPRILVPMVTTYEEVVRCREIIEQIRNDLREAGEPYADNVEFGVMVEVPAAVLILDMIMPLVDFVSVGTNDLVQYLLAVDRDNPRVAAMYDPYHPGVLRALDQIVTTAERAGRPASICGEIAGDHYFTPLLLGLGFRELSMTPVFLPRVKLMVRSFAIAECKELSQRAMRLASAAEVRALARESGRERWSRFLRSDKHGR
jgi:phosphoenolpyruvate-protein phosphotransferase